MYCCGARQGLVSPSAIELELRCLQWDHRACPIFLRIEKTGRCLSESEYLVATEGADTETRPCSKH